MNAVVVLADAVVVVCGGGCKTAGYQSSNGICVANLGTTRCEGGGGGG